MTNQPADRSERLPFDVNDLNPHMVGPIAALRDACFAAPFTIGRAQYVFHPFEGLRLPYRQDHLRAQGASKAGPWKSAHQYGLAVDFACYRIREDGVAVTPRWSWSDDAPWENLKRLAAVEGLDIPIAWDKGHVVHPLWNRIKAVLP